MLYPGVLEKQRGPTCIAESTRRLDSLLAGLAGDWNSKEVIIFSFRTPQTGVAIWLLASGGFAID